VTARRSRAVCTDMSVCLGKYWRQQAFGVLVGWPLPVGHRLLAAADPLTRQRRARSGSAARGAIALLVPVQVRLGRSRSAHRHSCLRNTSSRSRPHAGMSRTRCSLRLCGVASTPHSGQPVTLSAVSTSSSNSRLPGAKHHKLGQAEHRRGVGWPLVASFSNWDLL